MIDLTNWEGMNFMEIKAKSVFDYESIKALAYVTIYKRKDPRKAFVFMNVWCIALVLLIVMEMISFGVDGQLMMLLILAIVLALFNFYLYFGYAKIQYNALQHMKNTENTYTFCEDLIKVSSKGAQYNGEAELKYSMIPKVMETSKYLFIFQSKNQSFIVDKSTIVNGTVDEIRMKLVQSSKAKYIICRD